MNRHSVANDAGHEMKVEDPINDRHTRLYIRIDFVSVWSAGSPCDVEYMATIQDSSRRYSSGARLLSGCSES